MDELLIGWTYGTRGWFGDLFEIVQVEVFLVMTPRGFVVGYQLSEVHAASIFLVMTLCGFVVGYQRFRGTCSSIFWVVTPCSFVVGYQRFRGTCASIFWVVTPCSFVVGCQSFRGPYCLHLQESSSPWEPQTSHTWDCLVIYGVHGNERKAGA